LNQSNDEDRTTGPDDGGADIDEAYEASSAGHDAMSAEADPVGDASNMAEPEFPGEGTEMINSPSLDVTADGSLMPQSGFHDDPYIEFDNVTRKEIMRMTTDNSMRFYQSVVIKDHELLPIEEGARLFGAVLQHIVMGLSQTLSDQEMGLRFDEFAKRQNVEDPWHLSIRRERFRIEISRGEG
jgi:hypothetical protein